jgi:predicted Zn-dependent protease
MTPVAGSDGGGAPADLCQQVLGLVGGRAEAEVTASAGRSALTRFANSHIHQNVAVDHLDVRLRLVADGRLATAATGRVDDEGLARLVEGALDAARLRPPDPGWAGLAPPAVAPAVDRDDPATHRAQPEQRAGVVADFVAADPGLAAAGFCESAGSEVAFANSAGQALVGSTSRASLDGIHSVRARSRHSVRARSRHSVRAGSRHGTTTSDGAGWQASPRLADLDGAGAGRVAAAKARGGAGAVELEPGRYEVVLEPACVADMLDFLLDGFSAKAHAEGRSFVHLGEAVLDPAVSLRDDATDPGTIGLVFDAEGTPKRPLDLVVDGVPTALLHDRRTARRAGVESTGHAVAGGESFGPYAQNPVLAPGERPPAELLASLARGLLVTDFWYTRILDPKTQVVTGLTRNGTFLVEGGEIVAAVHNLRFTQSYADALAPGNVLGIGSDLRLRSSGALVPSLHLASWNFTGSVASEAGPPRRGG